MCVGRGGFVLRILIGGGECVEELACCCAHRSSLLLVAVRARHAFCAAKMGKAGFWAGNGDLILVFMLLGGAQRAR